MVEIEKEKENWGEKWNAITKEKKEYLASGKNNPTRRKEIGKGERLMMGGRRKI